MQEHYVDVIRALNNFEEEFETIATAKPRASKDS
jgi:hypothetical protein